MPCLSSSAVSALNESIRVSNAVVPVGAALHDHHRLRLQRDLLAERIGGLHRRRAAAAAGRRRGSAAAAGGVGGRAAGGLAGSAGWWPPARRRGRRRAGLPGSAPEAGRRRRSRAWRPAWMARRRSAATAPAGAGAGEASSSRRSAPTSGAGEKIDAVHSVVSQAVPSVDPGPRPRPRRPDPSASIRAMLTRSAGFRRYQIWTLGRADGRGPSPRIRRTGQPRIIRHIRQAGNSMSALANPHFAKMNGIGNEIVVVDLRDRPAAVTAEDARAVARRRRALRPADGAAAAARCRAPRPSSASTTMTARNPAPAATACAAWRAGCSQQTGQTAR